MNYQLLENEKLKLEKKIKKDKPAKKKELCKDIINENKINFLIDFLYKKTGI